MEKWRNKFTDFGGGPSRKEMDPETVAAREFHEETSCVIPFFDYENRSTFIFRRQWGNIRRALGNNQYNFCIRTNIEKTMEYVSYVVQVPWMPERVRGYKRTVKHILDRRDQSHKFKSFRSYRFPSYRNHPIMRKMTTHIQPFLEMDKIQYISIPKLIVLLKRGTICKYASDRLKKAMDLLISSGGPGMKGYTHP